MSAWDLNFATSPVTGWWCLWTVESQANSGQKTLLHYTGYSYWLDHTKTLLYYDSWHTHDPYILRVEFFLPATHDPKKYPFSPTGRPGRTWSKARLRSAVRPIKTGLAGDWARHKESSVLKGLSRWLIPIASMRRTVSLTIHEWLIFVW